MKNCPRCLANNPVKSGFVKGVQRYKCKQCSYFFTVDKVGRSIEPYIVIKALQLYLEGVSGREIERILGISHSVISVWVHFYGLHKVPRKKAQPTYKILTVDRLQEEFSPEKISSDEAYIVTPIGDKFMKISWKRFI